MSYKFNPFTGQLDEVGGSAPVQSVNTQTGTVSLGVEDLDNVQYNVTTSATVYEFTYAGTSTGTPASGEFKVMLASGTTDKIRISTTDANGTSVPSFSTGSTVWLSADGATYSTVTPTSFSLSGASYIFSLDSTDEDTYDALGITVGGTLYVSATDPDPQTVNPSNGEILKYDTASSKFKPTGVRALLGIDEYANDTAAGTGGLSSGELYYNTTSSSYVLKS